MKLTIVVLAAVFCLAHSGPVPGESIDLVNIPLSNNKVSRRFELKLEICIALGRS
jgi:hypothetical protein